MRKFRKFGLILTAAVLCLTAFSACAKYKPRHNVHIEGMSYIMRSPYEDPQAVNSRTYNGWHAYYVFQSDISPKTCDNVMDTAESILERFGYFDMTFYTLANCTTGYVDAEKVGNSDYFSMRENEIFLCIDDFSPVYITLACNQKKYGADISYGLMYAMSYGQCDEWGYSLPKRPTDSGIARLVREYPLITAFNTAVFQCDFASAEMKKAAEGLAVKLYEKLGVEGLEKLALSDNPNYSTDMLIDEICYSLGVEPLIYEPLSGYRMYQTGWYVVAESETVRVFMSKTYYDLCYPFFDSLEDYFYLLQGLPEQVKNLKEYMGVNECPRLEILYDGYFFFGPEWENANIARLTYWGWGKCASVYITTHELTHLLSEYYSADYINENALNAWTAEAFPDYMAALYDEYYYAVDKQLWLAFPANGNETLQTFNKIYAKYPPLNAVEFFDIVAYAYESTGFNGFYDHVYENNPKLLDQTAASLVNYLIETYGKDKFMELYFTHGATEQSVYGKDFYALRSEWFESLKARFES